MIIDQQVSYLMRGTAYGDAAMHEAMKKELRDRLVESEKTGKPDVRGAYGLHGREMIGWLTHLQHTRAKSVWLVGILDERLDDFNRRYFVPQIDGSKTGLELPGIVDEVITMAELSDEGGAPYRDRKSVV